MFELPRRELRHGLAAALAGDGILATPIYWTAIAVMVFAELLLAAHGLLLAVPPYRWLATAVVLAWSEDPIGEYRAWVAAGGYDRGQLSAGGLDLLGVTIMFIAVGVTVYAGFAVMSQTIQLTDLTGDTNTSDSVNTPVDPLADVQSNFTDSYGPMFGFIALILLVAFLAVIIIYLQAARGAGVGGR